MQYLKFLTISVVSLLSLSLVAQEDRRKAYEDFIKQRDAEFKDWREKANAEFTSYLEKSWEEFLVNTGRKDPVGEVPSNPEYYTDTQGNSSNAPDRSSGTQKSHGLPSPVEMGFPEAMLDMPIKATTITTSAVTLDFFGYPETIPFSETMILEDVIAKEKSVAKAWDVLSKSQYLPTVEAVSTLRERYGLNDWAVYTLVKEISEALYDESKINQRVVTQMFILSQLNYKVRTGSAGEQLVLLIPFQEPIYQVSYVTDANTDFFIFSYLPVGNRTPLYTFTQDFSMADRYISLKFNTQMKIGGATGYKKIALPLWSEILGNGFVVPINDPYIKFTYDYPQSDLLTYHKSVVDTETSKAVMRAVKLKVIKDKLSKEEAVAYILNLVQNGFKYKTDYEMFGRAKPLFVEESFYYGANNCKDRVLIFSWLVKGIVGYNTVLLGYPGHVACGVAFDTPVDGDSFDVEGERYVMCDPTYINAPVGATMPKFKNVAPTVYPL